MTEARWTPKLIEDWLEEAALTVRRLPPVKVQGHRSSWPPVVHDFYDAYGAEPATVRLGPPTAAAITRMDEAFVWLAWLEPDEARLLWARACGLPWKLLTYRFGASRTTLWRRWVAGLITIASRLQAPAGLTPDRMEHDCRPRCLASREAAHRPPRR